MFRGKPNDDTRVRRRPENSESEFRAPLFFRTLRHGARAPCIYIYI